MTGNLEVIITICHPISHRIQIFTLDLKKYYNNKYIFELNKRILIWNVFFVFIYFKETNLIVAAKICSSCM